MAIRTDDKMESGAADRATSSRPGHSLADFLPVELGGHVTASSALYHGKSGSAVPSVLPSKSMCCFVFFGASLSLILFACPWEFRCVLLCDVDFCFHTSDFTQGGSSPGILGKVASFSFRPVVSVFFVCACTSRVCM